MVSERNTDLYQHCNDWVGVSSVVEGWQATDMMLWLHDGGCAWHCKRSFGQEGKQSDFIGLVGARDVHRDFAAAAAIDDNESVGAG